MTFPFELQSTPEHQADLPEAVDLVVIGGGILGVCTAYYAAKAGLSVIVLEKGRVAAEQSSRNWGWIRVQGRDYDEIPVALEAQDLWKDLDKTCKGRLGVKQIGISYLSRSEEQAARHASWLEGAKPYGVSTVMQSKTDMITSLNWPHAGWVTAMHTPTDLRAEPWQAVPELARLAVSEGAMIRESCAVRGLDITAGKVSGVITETGRIRCEQVVLAGGAWSSLFLQHHGLHIPQLSVRSNVMATEPLENGPEIAATDGRAAFRHRSDGGYTLAPGGFAEFFIGRDSFRHLIPYVQHLMGGELNLRIMGVAPKDYPDAITTPRKWGDDEESPFERMRILNPSPNTARLEKMRQSFSSFFPQVGKVTPKRQWAGLVDVMPDVVPIVDHVAKIPGLIVATGMSGHGFGIGPGFGRVLADMVQGNKTGHDLSRFAFDRFGAGKKLKRGPHI